MTIQDFVANRKAPFLTPTCHPMTNRHKPLTTRPPPSNPNPIFCFAGRPVLMTIQDFVANRKNTFLTSTCHPMTNRHQPLTTRPPPSNPNPIFCFAGRPILMTIQDFVANRKAPFLTPTCPHDQSSSAVDDTAPTFKPQPHFLFRRAIRSLDYTGLCGE